MIRSMTAFSRLSVPLEEGLITLEIQSLNRKHLEITTLLPREFIEFDASIKKGIQKKLVRGKIQVYLSYVPHAKSRGIELLPNIPLAKEIKKGWQEISKHLEIEDKEEGLLRLLARESNLFEVSVAHSFSKTIKAPLFKILDEALDQLIEMREREGAFLKEELEGRIENLGHLVHEVAKLNQNSSHTQQEKLKERLEKLLESKIEKDERFFKEVAILADKADMTEEVTRIKSHLKAFIHALKETQKGHGKMLDFITQELNREWNTIGAKCADHEISNHVLKAKSECEKIREQIHNIE